MIKHFLIIFLFSFSIISAQTSTIKEELNKLDNLILEKENYLKPRLDSISNLKMSLAATTQYEKRYYLIEDIINLYMPINSDSTLYYANKACDLAIENNDSSRLINAKLHKIQSYIFMGLYYEAFTELQELKSRETTAYQKQRELDLYTNLYSFLSTNTNSINDRYKDLYSIYQDSLLYLYPRNSFSDKIAHANVLINNKDYEEAIGILTSLLNGFNLNDRSYATIAYMLSQCYAEQENTQKQLYYLTKSSQSDIICGVKEHAALSKLALILYKNDDINRAYNYIRISLNDAIESNTQVRRQEVIDILPLIDYAYQNYKKKQQNVYLIFFLIILFLLIVLSINLLALRRQKNSLKISNLEVKEYNEQLEELNKLLKESENKLKEVNLSLEHDIEIQSEHIAKYLKLSSSYIAKFDAYRKRLLSKSSQLNKGDIIEELKSKSIIESELKTFYKEFDLAFLKLYPNFIDSYNELMKDQHKVKIRKDKLLNTELRIFALIRLGIDESNQIAEFLRYSPTTIYNYRTKARNNTTVERDFFEDEVKNIQ